MYKVIVSLEENGKDLGSHYIGMEEESIARKLFNLMGDLLKICSKHLRKE